MEVDAVRVVAPNSNKLHMYVYVLVYKRTAAAATRVHSRAR